MIGRGKLLICTQYSLFLSIRQMASPQLSKRYNIGTIDAVDHQAELNIFGDHSQPESLFNCVNFDPIRSLQSPPESALELNRSQDNLAVLDYVGQNVHQETKIGQEEPPANESETGSIKHNFCKFLGKNVRRIARAQLDNNISLQTQYYLQFMLKNLKNTRRSLRQFLINYPRPSLLKKFQIFHSDSNQQQSQAKTQDIFDEGTEYLRKLICSKQTQMKAEVKTQEKKEEFRLFIQRTIQDLKENKMRGKDEKNPTKRSLESVLGNSALRQRKTSTHNIITNPLILPQCPKLVDSSCFSAQQSSLNPQS